MIALAWRRVAGKMSGPLRVRRVVLLVVSCVGLVGCGGAATTSGGSSSDAGTSTPTPTAATGTPSVTAGVVTTSTGFRFSVLSGTPRSVAQYTDAGTSEVAPPGEHYVEILVNFTNLQADRAAPLMDLVAPNRVPSMVGALPAAEVSGANCLAATNGDKLPNGWCIDSSATGQLLLADGNDVQAALNLMETPSVPAGGSLRASFFYGPVASTFTASTLRLFVGSGSGTTTAIPPA